MWPGKVGRQHIICLHVLRVMMKRGVVFNSDHLENSLRTSQNVMDLSTEILFFQERPGILHPPYCMDRLDIEWNSPTYLENSCTQQEDNNEYQLSFQVNS